MAEVELTAVDGRVAAREAAMRVAAARAAEAVPVVMVDVLVVETAAAPRVVVTMAAVAMAEAAAEAAVKVVAAECSLLLVHRCHSPRSCRRRRHHCGHAPCTSTCNGLWTGEGAARTLQPCRDVGLSSWNQAAMCSWHDAAMPRRNLRNSTLCVS